jgi:hypothetical protein
MKVSLDDIPASFIRTGGVLVTRVPETEWDGSPNCSTGKDFQGWNPAEPTLACCRGRMLLSSGSGGTRST